jgi:hypothetical protein
MRNLTNNNIITLKGTWEYFVIFLKFIKSIIDGLYKIVYGLMLPAYFIYGFYLMFTKQPLGEGYLFIGLLVIYSELNEHKKDKK